MILRCCSDVGLIAFRVIQRFTKATTCRRCTDMSVAIRKEKERLRVGSGDQKSLIVDAESEHISSSLDVDTKIIEVQNC